MFARKGREEIKITARSVIIATGGYGGNKELLKKYSTDYCDNMACAGLPHKRDGLIMATGIGAAHEGLGILQMSGPASPHNAPRPNLGTPPNKFRIHLMAIALEPNTIWVNKRGMVFIDESMGFHHYESSNAVVRQPDNVVYALLDSKLVQTMDEEGLILGMGTPEGAQGNKLHGLERELRKVVDKDLVSISRSWDEMAKWIGADPKVLKATIQEYNAACDQGHDRIFVKDRKYLVPLRTAPYYAIKCHGNLMNTIGGIKINEHMEVIGKQGHPIPGLFAAGVDTGGWESETYCALLSGSAFGFAVNSGRIAGENANTYSAVKK